MKRLQARVSMGLVIIALFISCSTTVQAASADVNSDGVVNLADLAHVASYWLHACDDCGGKQCGDDNCGGSCGVCGREQACRSYQCVPYCSYSGFGGPSFEMSRYLPGIQKLGYWATAESGVGQR